MKGNMIRLYIQNITKIYIFLLQIVQEEVQQNCQVTYIYKSFKRKQIVAIIIILNELILIIPARFRTSLSK